VATLAARIPPAAGLMVITAAYTGLRWGELAGLQWTRTHLDVADPRLNIDPHDGALHELGGRLELGPPKTPASARTVHLPPFLADLLIQHRDSGLDAPFVFTGAQGGLHRRANFRQRFWQPALVGNPEQGRAPLNPEMHFHDLRHTHETWLVEDGVPRVLRLQRLGHKRKDIDDFYSHVTHTMREKLLDALQRRWERGNSRDDVQNINQGPEAA